MKCVWECKVVSELIELSSVIGDIYDAAIDAGLWQQVLGRICNYVGGYAAVLFWHDAATQNAQALHLFNDNPNFTRLCRWIRSSRLPVSSNPASSAAAPRLFLRRSSSRRASTRNGSSRRGSSMP